MIRLTLQIDMNNENGTRRPLTRDLNRMKCSTYLCHVVTLDPNMPKPSSPLMSSSQTQPWHRHKLCLLLHKIGLQKRILEFKKKYIFFGLINQEVG